MHPSIHIQTHIHIHTHVHTHVVRTHSLNGGIQSPYEALAYINHVPGQSSADNDGSQSNDGALPSHAHSVSTPTDNGTGSNGSNGAGAEGEGGGVRGAQKRGAEELVDSGIEEGAGAAGTAAAAATAAAGARSESHAHASTSQPTLEGEQQQGTGAGAAPARLEDRDDASGANGILFSFLAVTSCSSLFTVRLSCFLLFKYEDAHVLNWRTGMMPQVLIR